MKICLACRLCRWIATDFDKCFSALMVSSAGVIRETDGQVYVDLGAWEEQALGAQTSTPASSGTTTGASL
ncbi:hypothetical protein [Scytonema sp. NUACC26]|uniref:hypothetical protein n=1 Tax=Scytonema sp. NUACC26 TaxID=3140176 RepID=UPI0038B27580